jgi:hypothetical protein
MCNRQKWIVGKQYPVVTGELYYMAIRSEEKLTELMEWQVSRTNFPSYSLLLPHNIFKAHCSQPVLSMLLEDEVIAAADLRVGHLLAGEEWHRPRPHLLHPGLLSPSPGSILMLYAAIPWHRSQLQETADHWPSTRIRSNFQRA